jgi:hypothetical protein
LGSIDYKKAENAEVLPDDYLDKNNFTYSIGFYTQNRSLYNLDQMGTGAISFDLYPPIPIAFQQDTSQLIPINSFISTDSSKNPSITDSKNGSHHLNQFDARSQSSTGLFCFGFGQFKGIMPSGVWQLKKNSSEVTSRFDLGLGNPFDSVSGKLQVYVPSVRITVGADSIVQSVTLRWYSWNAASNSYVRAIDNEVLQNAVSNTEVQFANWAVPGAGEKIRFGVNSDGMQEQAAVSTEMVVTPKQTYKYAAPLDIGVGYSSLGQGFGLEIRHW